MGWNTKDGMSSSPEMPRLLVVEHDEGLREFVDAFLREEGYGVACASSLPQALALTEGQVFHGIFSSLFPRSY